MIDRTVTPARVAIVVFIIIFSAVLARFYGAAMLGLGVDESYMVVMARHPSLSYFDHPPLTFWIVHVTAWLTGSEAGFVLRTPFIAMSVVSTLLLYQLTARFYGAKAGAWAIAWFSISPFFLLSAGSWIVPDGPMMLFLLVAASLLVPLVNPDRSHISKMRWGIAGLAFGLALLSKYMAVLSGLGVLLFLLSNRTRWPLLRSSGLYIAVTIALLVFSPVIYWNAVNGWQPFGFQLSRSVSSSDFEPVVHLINSGRMLLGQLAYLQPVTLIVFLWLLLRHFRSAEKTRADRYLLCLAIVPIVVFNAVALLSRNTLPHWPMAGYLFLFPLLGSWFASLKPTGAATAKRAFAASAGVILTVVVLGGLHFKTGILTRPLVSAARWDDTIRAMDWFDVREALHRRGFLQADEPRLIYTLNWIDGAKIAYALGDQAHVRVLGSDQRHFGLLPELTSDLERKVLVAGLLPSDDWEERLRRVHAALAGSYCSITPDEPITINRGGLPYRALFLLSASSC
ncbi:Undecaprenyl phosphate-alpha-4-amino-4-deoxy-L-arabinose arabinosyl transferase [Pseudovibrio sp. Ad46]|uniref:ArnT family glycosyltransferase n=1 Tax=Pseudovibrio sp. Ad46 TaxID=989432 RepID=UPI0007AE7BE1|nr:glycosyltransferase family 39 protein [Pseudovibrio sp. Ad46]KZK88528.1 Undecaprenyl phosphate-alpha-4-amino-4-deoxy-L-arabinose arabinosyl transferase [Pseudovibrio sp. Ad46]